MSAGHGTINVVDPVTNDAWKVVIPTREDPRKVNTRFPPPSRPSNFWGMDHLWGTEQPSDPHNPMMDERGRVWNTSKIRNEQPAFCREGSSNNFAQYYPLRNNQGDVEAVLGVDVPAEKWASLVGWRRLGVIAILVVMETALLVFSCLVLVLRASIAKRRRAQHKLRAFQHRLERQVEERTEDVVEAQRQAMQSEKLA